MGRIQSSVGLITGVPIRDTIKQLLEISARPRDLLQSRNASLQEQQVAVTKLTASVISVQLATAKLGKPELFNETKVSSSDNSLLAVSKTGTPKAGNYPFTPIQQAQAHQLLSSGVASADQPLGEGQLSLRFGGFVDQAIQLNELNGGQGVERGKIRITDRSGATEVIDLRYAQTIDDVLLAINEADGINLTASTRGDALQLTDHTGQTKSNLQVKEVGLGSTAADLGLGGVDEAADTVVGGDLLQLHGGTRLSQLNNGAGVSFRKGLPDLSISFADGSAPLEIDVGDFAPAEGEPPEHPTIDDLLRVLQEADPQRLDARISASGDSLELIDLTSGSGSFEVHSPLDGSAAEDLGLTQTAVNGVITGGRLQAGLKTSLLSSLNGGRGIGERGVLSLTDRGGTSDSVNLQSAETLEDVQRLINDASTGIVAKINAARNGLELQDTTNGTQNLVVASGDATNTAEALGLEIDDAVSRVDGGSLRLQVFYEHESLEQLNGGQGVGKGSFVITDSNGRSGAVSMSLLKPETVGDVLDAINALSIDVQAEINPDGDGIRLRDVAGGSGTLNVLNSGSGTAAKDLGLLSEATQAEVDGSTVQVIDGSSSLEIDIGAEDSLQDVVDRINESGYGITASIFNEGNGSSPFRLALSSEVDGKAGELQVDASQTPFAFREVSAAQDALLLVGSPSGSNAGVLASSSDNVFEDVAEGLRLTVQGASTDPVNIQVSSTDKSLVSNVQLFVTKYNELMKRLDELTVFDEATNTTGVLFGSNEALRVENGLSRLVSGRFFGVGSLQSLEQVGISLDEDGQIDFDKQKLQDAFAEDPQAVEQLFATDEIGVAAKFDALIDRLAGQENSLLINRNQTLQSRIDLNKERVEFITGRLDRQRELLLKQFTAMETTIARLQSNLSAIDKIQPISPLVSTRR